MAYIVSQRAYTRQSLDHSVCTVVCICTPRLSSTLYSLLELYLSVVLVVILSHPQLCTVAAVAPYPAVCIWCGLEACSVCLWCVCARGVCAVCIRLQCSLCCVYAAVLTCTVLLCCALRL